MSDAHELQPVIFYYLIDLKVVKCGPLTLAANSKALPRCG
jgi:hypothetical protein